MTDTYIYSFFVIFLLHELVEYLLLDKECIKADSTSFKERKLKNYILSKIKGIDSFAFKTTIIEEVILIIGLLAYIINKSNYDLFIGIFVAYTFHIVIHVIQILIIKVCLPFIITVAISIGYSTVFVIYIVQNELITHSSIIYILSALIFMYLNLLIMLKITPIIKRTLRCD